jgi:hypothetical protein
MKKLLPKSQIGKTFSYSAARWKALYCFLHDGHLEIDKNLMKNTIRLVALGCTPIDQVEITTKTHASMATLMETLQYIYTHPVWNRRIFDLLSKKISAGTKQIGLRGMCLWEVFILGQVRLCLDLSYDERLFMSNDNSLLRGILGVLPTDFSTGKQYEYQNIYDNVGLLDEQLLREINDVIVEMGHEVLKKKRPMFTSRPFITCFGTATANTSILPKNCPSPAGVRANTGNAA